jgi:hypothetical protein
MKSPFSSTSPFIILAIVSLTGCQSLKESAPPGTFLYNLNEWNKDKAAGATFGDRVSNHTKRVRQNGTGQTQSYYVAPGGAVVGVGGPSSVVGSTKPGYKSDNPNFIPNERLGQQKVPIGATTGSDPRATWSKVVGISNRGGVWSDEFGHVYQKSGKGFRDEYGNIYNPLGGGRYSR